MTLRVNKDELSWVAPSGQVVQKSSWSEGQSHVRIRSDHGRTYGKSLFAKPGSTRKET